MSAGDHQATRGHVADFAETPPSTLGWCCRRLMNSRSQLWGFPRRATCCVVKNSTNGKVICHEDEPNECFSRRRHLPADTNGVGGEKSSEAGHVTTISSRLIRPEWNFGDFGNEEESMEQPVDAASSINRTTNDANTIRCGLLEKTTGKCN